MYFVDVINKFKSLMNTNVFLDCPKMHFQDFQKHILLNIFFKFWNSDLKTSDKLSFCLKNKWQTTEEQLQKQYSNRIDFVSLFLEILLGFF